MERPSAREIFPIVSAPRSRRTAFPPSGRGRDRLLLPEGAEVAEEPEALLLPRQLPLVDHDARVDLARGDRLADAVEGDDDRDRARHAHPERERRGREGAGDRDAPSVERGERRGRVGRLARDDARAVAVAERGAVREEDVRVREVGVGVERDRRDRELAARERARSASRCRRARGGRRALPCRPRPARSP